jgi:hypothetical protein
MIGKILSPERRQEVFAALVDAQYDGLPVQQSRKHISERFAISEGEVCRIEREGA